MSCSNRLRITRRAALGAALLATGGCTLEEGGAPPPSPGGSPAATGPDSDSDSDSDPDFDPDVDRDLLGEARTELQETLDLVRRTSQQHLGLATALAPLAGLHEAHDALLAESTDSVVETQGADPVPSRSARALELVRRREVALQAEFASLAVRAQSGPLARLLASMSAGIAQHTTQLPPSRREAA